jgi:hypothetical protein
MAEETEVAIIMGEIFSFLAFGLDEKVELGMELSVKT